MSYESEYHELHDCRQAPSNSPWTKDRKGTCCMTTKAIVITIAHMYPFYAVVDNVSSFEPEDLQPCENGIGCTFLKIFPDELIPSTCGVQAVLNGQPGALATKFCCSYFSLFHRIVSAPDSMDTHDLCMVLPSKSKMSDSAVMSTLKEVSKPFSIVTLPWTSAYPEHLVWNDDSPWLRMAVENDPQWAKHGMPSGTPVLGLNGVKSSSFNVREKAPSTCWNVTTIKKYSLNRQLQVNLANQQRKTGWFFDFGFFDLVYFRCCDGDLLWKSIKIRNIRLFTFSALLRNGCP